MFLRKSAEWRSAPGGSKHLSLRRRFSTCRAAIHFGGPDREFGDRPIDFVGPSSFPPAIPLDRIHRPGARRMTRLLILFAESLSVRFAIRIKEFLAALVPRRFE